MRRARAVWTTCATLLCLTPALHGCANLGYYAQAAAGELEIISKRRPMATVLVARDLPVETRRRLALVTRLRRFAVDELALLDNGSYRSYAELKRRFVVWNVFATPELSLEPVRSCFPVVGCLSYRGYFHEDAARAYAGTLRVRGDDVFVGGVAAYSTLGWFDDPVLDTMLRWDDARIARFIFHELAHQKLYVTDDSAFNEAFADTVADIGVERWFSTQADPGENARLRVVDQHERDFIGIVLDARSKLADLYNSALSAADKRREKRRIFDALRRDHVQLKTVWGGDSSYDSWMREDLNNAKIAAVATYREQIPAFKAILEGAGQRLERFYELAAAIGALAPGKRSACLRGLHLKGASYLPECLGQFTGKRQ